MINEMLIIVKAEEIVSIIRNVVVPFIEVEDYKQGHIHTFELVNVE